MYQLIYTSQATIPFTQEALKKLLKQSKQWNEQVGITGVLLYNDEQFVQVLEGSIEAVSDLFGKLLRDLRHHNVMRRFGEWSMSFHAVESAQMARVRGYFTPAHLDLHYQNLHSPDELLLQVIEGFMHNPVVKL
jgi:hypothetical protein